MLVDFCLSFLPIKNLEEHSWMDGIYIYRYTCVYGPASLGTSPPPHPMVLGLYTSAPVPPSPPVVWVVWVVVGGGGGGRSCICMYMNVYVWYECIFLVFVYDCDMSCI